MTAISTPCSRVSVPSILSFEKLPFTAQSAPSPSLSKGKTRKRFGHCFWASMFTQKARPHHKAIEKGHAPIVCLLLQANTSAKARMQAMPFRVNQFNYANATALHYAVWKGDPSIVQALLDRGANIHARTGSDMAEALPVPFNVGWRITPLDLAHCLDESKGPIERCSRHLQPDRLAIAPMLLERGGIFSVFIAKQ
ncbi:hypothetical protein BKA70DRAFT_1278713 [Coprinopsis sp. MPI-PUGE-AT-0042]|nr:hypothetical protein BKA70DRAFT_1278713 [Coprinopsis sp. MPI-PUGE-AT-0042]